MPISVCTSKRCATISVTASLIDRVHSYINSLFHSRGLRWWQYDLKQFNSYWTIYTDFLEKRFDFRIPNNSFLCVHPGNVLRCMKMKCCKEESEEYILRVLTLDISIGYLTTIVFSKRKSWFYWQLRNSSSILINLDSQVKIKCLTNVLSRHLIYVFFIYLGYSRSLMVSDEIILWHCGKIILALYRDSNTLVKFALSKLSFYYSLFKRLLV